MLVDKYSRGQGAGITGITANRSFPGLGLTLNVDITVKYFFSSISLITQKITNASIPSELNFTYSKLFSFLPSRRQKLFLEYGYNTNSDEFKVNDAILAETKRFPLIIIFNSLKLPKAKRRPISSKVICFLVLNPCSLNN